MCLRVRADGGSLLLTAPYDEGLRELIKSLPTRRWRPASKDWSVPARRADLRAIVDLVGQVEERAITVDLDPTVRARLRPLGLTRVLLRGDEVEIVGPYDKDRLQAQRQLPESRYDKERTSWLVPLTRAGAIALLALVDDEHYVVTQKARDALERTADPRMASAVGGPRRDSAEPGGASPRAHWRFVTRGAMFNSPHARRVKRTDSNGRERWGVYVRVDPTLTPNERRALNSNPPARPPGGADAHAR